MTSNHTKKYMRNMRYLLLIFMTGGIILGWLLRTKYEKQCALRCSSHLRDWWWAIHCTNVEGTLSLTNTDPSLGEKNIRQLIVDLKGKECPCGGKYLLDTNTTNIMCTYHHGDHVGVVSWGVGRMIVAPWKLAIESERNIKIIPGKIDRDR